MAPPPTLRLIASDREAPPLSPQTKALALIGSYPPRRCGIASFTADVRRALLEARPDLVCEVYAMTEGGDDCVYPEETRQEIVQQRPADYLAAAARLTETRAEVICVEHEFGIYGGSAGEHLMLLLDAVDRPVVSTLHTVLDRPNDDQWRVFSRLLARSARLVVMAERGRRILRETWGVADEKISVIPHGAPDRPLLDPQPFKEKLGFADRDLLFTFGLLSPNKGLETVIHALPEIVKTRPDTLYVVLGATHPVLIARQGEHYRESLRDLAEQLGVGDHLRMIDTYTDTPQLLEYLHAADVFLTPYLNPAQITSGALSYAAALGKPIVSTPYWHAEDMLADGGGRLVPFGDSAAFAAEITALLSDEPARQALGKRIYRSSRPTVWSAYAQGMLAVIDAARAERRPAIESAKPPARLAPSLTALRRMTDSCGLMQHSLFDIPDRNHGYCVDDNARALMLMYRLPGEPTAERRRLTTIYAAFVQHAWNEEEGRFRNFMNYERQWMETGGSQDSTGRAALSVAISLADSQDPGHRLWAETLMRRVLPRLETIDSRRADAFILKGLAALLTRGWNRDRVQAMAEAKLERLLVPLKARRRDGLPWFEGILAYDNARLPEAAIRAGRAVGDVEAVSLGLEALDWLCRRQTAPSGDFLPVATADFGKPLDERRLFDQQPVESAATIDACEAAFAVTSDRRWIVEAARAYSWFEGANSLGVPLATADGECLDGLTPEGPNMNMGAESMLSFQLGACAWLRLTALASGALETAGDR